MAKKAHPAVEYTTGDPENHLGPEKQGKPDIARPEHSIDTFEEDLGEVERIVRQLEGGQLSLGEALKEYEKGVGRLKRCYSSLESAQRRVELLTGVDSAGNPITEKYETTSLSLEEKQATRGRRRGATQGAEPRSGATNLSFLESSDGTMVSKDSDESMDDSGELF